MPFLPMIGVGFEKPLSFLNINFQKIYAQARVGDRVYVEFLIRTQQNEEIYLNIKGNGIVWFEGEQRAEIWKNQAIPKLEFSHDSFHIPLTVFHDQANRVRIQCTKTEENFEIGILLSVRRYPWIWATDYLCNLRVVSPRKELEGEDGVAISEIYHKEEKMTTLTYALPKVQDTTIFHFDKLFEKGKLAYVYTEAKRDHILKLNGTITRIWLNGILWNGNKTEVSVRQADTILIECKRQGELWDLDMAKEDIGLSFLRSHRRFGDHAVCLGGFSQTNVFPVDFPIDFSRVPKDTDGTDLYWKFADASELRIYLDSIFYGQWFYAFMVGFYGIRKAGEVLDKKEYTDYFYENMKTLANYYPYAVYDTKKHGSAAFMSRCAAVTDLDGCGTMGMNLIDACTMREDDSMKSLIADLTELVSHGIPHWADGTYFRKETMWTDDLYMSCPFLIRLAEFTHNDAWEREVLKQIRGYKKRLYMDDQDLFSHIFFVQNHQSNRVPWGRGNGWVLWTLAEVLEHMQEGSEWDEILQIFQQYAAGINKLQDESGLWRQVLNSKRKETYLETS
ncbi:MAG: glycoside hydrolase family 88 protein, partial [Hungatella sp.]